MKEKCGTCLSESIIFHLAWCVPVPSILVRLTGFQSSLWLNTIQLKLNLKNWLFPSYVFSLVIFFYFYSPKTFL